MQKELYREKALESLIFWPVAAGVLSADIASKFWTLRVLAPPLGEGSAPPEVSVIPDTLRFIYAENTGAAFSMFRDHPGVLALIASVLAVAVVAWAHLLPLGERVNRAALGMVFGGAVGNLIDRFHHGFVVDFIQLHWRGRPLFATFNLADSAICIGVGVLFLMSWFGMRKASQPAGAVGQADKPKSRSS